MTCSICLEPKTHAVYLYPCGHDFNQGCVDSLAQRLCPECRTPFTGYAPAYTVRNSVGEDVRYVTSLFTSGIIRPFEEDAEGESPFSIACSKKDFVFVKAAFEQCRTFDALMITVRIALENNLEAAEVGLSHIEPHFNCVVLGRDIRIFHSLTVAFKLDRLNNFLRSQYPECRNCGLVSPLHLTVVLGWDKAVSNLLASGVDVAPRDSEGQTPLHLATYFERAEYVRLLLSRIEDPNPQNNQGKTPLHFAIEKGHAGIVRALLEKDASPFLRDHLDISVYDIVTRSTYDSPEIKQLVLTYAKITTY